MDYSNRNWIIVNVSDITEEMFENAIETSMNSLRKSLDDSKAILKWEGDTPECFESYSVYSHSEILQELAKSDWNREL